MAAPTSIVRNNVLGKLEIIVGANPAVEILLDRGDGSLSPLDKYLNERVRVERRGNHVVTIWGKRIYPALTLSSYWSELIGSDDVAPGTLAEALFQVGAYDDDDSLIPPTCTMRWTIYGSVAGLANDEVIEMTEVAASIDLSEAEDGNTITINALVEGQVSVTRGSKTIVFKEITAA